MTECAYVHCEADATIPVDPIDGSDIKWFCAAHNPLEDELAADHFRPVEGGDG